MRWFGQPYGAPYEADTEPAPVPVGDRCHWCGESVCEADSGLLVPYYDGKGPPRELPYHYACHFRRIVGGLNHQLGQCTCCGGTEEPDPPGLTRRQAAELATEHWQFGARRQ